MDPEPRPDHCLGVWCVDRVRPYIRHAVIFVFDAEKIGEGKERGGNNTGGGLPMQSFFFFVYCRAKPYWWPVAGRSGSDSLTYDVCVFTFVVVSGLKPRTSLLQVGVRESVPI